MGTGGEVAMSSKLSERQNAVWGRQASEGRPGYKYRREHPPCFGREEGRGPCCDMYAKPNNKGKVRIGISLTSEEDCKKYEMTGLSVNNRDLNTIHIHRCVGVDNDRYACRDDDDVGWFCAVLSHETMHVVLNRLDEIEASYALDVLHGECGFCENGLSLDTGIEIGWFGMFEAFDQIKAWKLRQDEKKHGKKASDLSYSYLVDKLVEEVLEVQSAYERGDWGGKHGVLAELLDVGNVMETILRNRRDRSVNIGKELADVGKIVIPN